jgi:hypothetical protein
MDGNMDSKQEFNKEVKKSQEILDKALAAPLPEGVVTEITDIENDRISMLYQKAGELAKKKKESSPK